jgi:phosphoenolpyruvate phosphomutase
MAMESKVTSWQRIPALKNIIARKGMARLLEAHSGLSGIIADTARVERDGAVLEYDGLWESSLTDSASKGLPDASIIGYESRMHTIDEILYVTTKPMVVDGDTGGEPAQFAYLVKHLERRGVSGVIIEDKVYPKRNSLDAAADQSLEDPAVFANKIRAGQAAKLLGEFWVIARLESLIAGVGVRDALRRAEQYIDAGVDGIMIHSAKKDPQEIFAFVEAYDRLCRGLSRRPVLVSVPTVYNTVTDTELADRGFNVIIHANHLLRSAYRAMIEAAETILTAGRSLEADPLCTPVSKIFHAVGFDRITERDRELSRVTHPPVIIPAAGRDAVFTDRPKSLVPIAGRTLIDFQLEAIRRAGLNQVVVIRGHEGAQFDERFQGAPVTLCANPRYDATFDLFSLFQAEGHLEHGFFLVYADILFDHTILPRLLGAGQDIVLAVDGSYRYHKHQVDKRLDLVAARTRRPTARRALATSVLTEIAQIGKRLDMDAADYEFTGIAYFSPRGAARLREQYHACLRAVTGSFHEAPSLERASLTDILQDLVDGGVPVYGLELHQGWLEIHTAEDVAIAERELVPALNARGVEIPV